MHHAAMTVAARLATTDRSLSESLYILLLLCAVVPRCSGGSAGSCSATQGVNARPVTPQFAEPASRYSLQQQLAATVGTVTVL
jgi:hypothetical protein